LNAKRGKLNEYHSTFSVIKEECPSTNEFFDVWLPAYERLDNILKMRVSTDFSERKIQYGELEEELGRFAAIFDEIWKSARKKLPGGIEEAGSSVGPLESAASSSSALPPTTASSLGGGEEKVPDDGLVPTPERMHREHLSRILRGANGMPILDVLMGRGGLATFSTLLGLPQLNADAAVSAAIESRDLKPED